jgi:hypothetical protein
MFHRVRYPRILREETFQGSSRFDPIDHLIYLIFIFVERDQSRFDLQLGLQSMDYSTIEVAFTENFRQKVFMGK